MTAVRTTPAAVSASRLFWDQAVETMPREHLLRLQEGRLLEAVPRFYRNSALIREMWDTAGVTPDDITSVGDFISSVPLMDKDDIRNHRHKTGDPFGGILTERLGDLATVGTTSGTTGRPMPLPYLPQNPTRWGQARDAWMIGLRPGDRIVRPLFVFRGGHLLDGSTDIGCVPVFCDHDAEEAPQIVDAVQRFDAAGIFLLSSTLINGIQEWCDAESLDPRQVFSTVRSAVFAGEPLSARTRSITDGWGVEVFEMSSLGDICPTMECTQHDGMHCWEDFALIELADPVTGGHLGDEASYGELIVTSLADPATALVRYCTGDIVTVNRDECGCGRTHLRIKPVGRKGDGVIVGDKHILAVSIWETVESNPDTAHGLFQIVRREPVMDALHVRVGSSGSADDYELLSVQLADQIGRLLDVPCVVEVVPDARLLELGPPHKIPRIVNL